MSDRTVSPRILAVAKIAKRRANNNLKRQQQLQDKGTVWERVHHAEIDDNGNWNEAGVELFEMLTRAPDVRGAIGETVLHAALTRDQSPSQVALVHEIVKRFGPKLVNTACDDPEYIGQTPLHIAVANQQIELVELLLTYSKNRAEAAYVSAKATGTFCSRDGFAPYGQYALSFAACCDNIPIVNLILHNAREQDHKIEDIINWAVDVEDNTILHLMVEQSLPEMFTYLVSQGAQLHRRNKKGYTPLCLAAATGNKVMLQVIFDTISEDVQVYSNVRTVSTPLREIDTVYELEGAAYEDNRGALELIVANNHADLMGIPLVHELFAAKWAKFAQRRYTIDFALAIAFIAVYVTGLALPRGSVVSLVLLAIAASAALLKLGLELRYVFHDDYKRYFLTATTVEYLEFFGELFVIVSFILSLTGHVWASFQLQGPACVILALYMLSFATCFNFTGPFCVCVFEVIKRDVSRFGLIFSVVIFGFAQALFLCFRGTDNAAWASIPKATMQLMRMTAGDTSHFSDFGSATHPRLAIALFILFEIFSVIVMLNLLIAMMMNTYGKINDTATNVWRLSRARVIVHIEERLQDKERLALRLGERLEDRTELPEDEDSGYFWMQEQVDAKCA